MDADVGDMANANEKNSAICEMPWHILQRSFALLSWHSISEISKVCEEWTTAIHSTGFRALRITRQQWFIVFEKDSVTKEMNCWAYDFTVNKWNELTVSFFPSPKPTYLFSDAGQISVKSSPVIYRRSLWQALWIWNPLTQMVLELSPMVEEGMTVACCEGDKKESFTVLGFKGRTIDIYSFVNNRWRTVADLPRGFRVIKAVCCNGFLFMMGYPPGIIVYNIQDFSFVKCVPTPLTYWVEADLLVCGSSVLFVGGAVKKHRFRDMSIWELHLNDSNQEFWKKIAEMPRPMLKEMLMSEEVKDWMSCEGVEDCACFSGMRVTKIVVFDLTHQRWSYLPQRPIISGYATAWTMAFYTNREHLHRSA